MGIFISYRRSDSQDIVGRIADNLHHRFDNVFQDLGSIEPGADFEVRTLAALRSANVVLAVIGPDWMSAGKVHSQKDWVRRELELALQRTDLVVIPVLVRGAALPRPEDLPNTLLPLLNRQAIAIDSGAGFRDDMRALTTVLAGYLRSPPAPKPNWLLFVGGPAMAGALGVGLWHAMKDDGQDVSDAVDAVVDATTMLDANSTQAGNPDTGAAPVVALEAGSKEVDRQCTPGQVQTRDCGNCGRQRRRCSPEGAWGRYGSCEDQGECQPGETRRVSCARFGFRTDICSSACDWQEGECINQAGPQPGRDAGGHGTCTGQGNCQPGERRPCGATHATCKQGTSTCTAKCEWGQCLGASCEPFAVQTEVPDHHCGVNYIQSSICNVDFVAKCPAGSAAVGGCDAVRNAGGRGSCTLIQTTADGRTTKARVRIEVGPTEGTVCRIDKCYCKYNET